MTKYSISSHLAATDKQSRLPLLYFAILLSIMHICDILAFKTVSFFGFNFAFTGIFFPISFLLLTALTESYGHIETERHILYILIGQTILITVVSFTVRLDISDHSSISNLYYQLYENLYRLLVSSNLAVGLSYYFTSLINSKFKCWLLGKMWWIRFMIANGIGQLILVSISYPINFYGILPTNEILHICLNTWMFKMLLILVLLGLSPLLIYINKHVDHVEVYDFNVLYNPIKMYKLGNYGRNYFGKSTRSFKMENPNE